MRSVIIFSNPWIGIGGAENTVCCMAEALSAFGTVDIVHGKDDFNDLGMLEERFGVSMKNTRLIKAWPPQETWELVHNPMKRMRMVKEAHQPFSRGYDACIVVTHDFPPFAAARVNILHTLFPFGTPLDRLAKLEGRSVKSRVMRRVKSFYHRAEHEARLKSYDVLTVNSEYSATWARQRWSAKRPWRVWYPPCNIVRHGRRTETPGSILMVGRIAPEKYPLEMTDWFARLSTEAPGSRLTMAGTFNPATQAHFDALIARAAGLDLRVARNLSHGELQNLYGSSLVFWHAMGFGKSDEKPELFEHFGMTTVEAMSAGCVPVVFGRGGQAEIVRHGEDGFTWTDPADLIKYTKLLLSDEPLRQRMSEKATERASAYSKEIFEERLLAVVRELLPEHTANPDHARQASNAGPLRETEAVRQC